ncbi:MAG: Holliday junction resolvase-like protein [Treponema sp.]|uniref:Holliday junction resolvase-like protein n=1 Tax=Treponema sp. TaxID=166 RepID=UPI003FA1DE0E
MIEVKLLLFILIVAGIFFIIIAFFLGIKIGNLSASKHLAEEIRRAREDAVKRSRAVLNGQFSEQFAPFFPDFPANPTESRFIGKPVDFIAFSGLSSSSINEVLFIEVKTGNSRLSKPEQSLRDAIEHKRVRYAEYRIPAAKA